MKRKAQRFLSLFLAALLTFGMVTPVNAAPVQMPFVEVTVEEEHKETEEMVETEEAVDEKTEESVEAEENADKKTEESVETDKEESVEAEEVVDTEKEEPVNIVSKKFDVEEILSMLKSQNFKWDVRGKAYAVDTASVDVSGVSAYSVAPEEEVVVDENDHAVMALAAELDDTEVQDDDGNKVALSEKQIQQILYVYQQYLDQWKANANILGVQMPFFLSYNDNGSDGLGILGEMLVLAGYSVNDVRNGKYSFDDLMGMVQNFLYADQFAIQYYSSAITNARKEALNAVEKSGAKTLPQKMLVLNDWIAHNAIFDMPYIMKDDAGNQIMVAKDPQKHEHYDEIYAAMKDVYTEQITKQFHDQIYDGIVADFRQKAYEDAIKTGMRDGYKSQVRQGVIDQCLEQGMTQEEAEAYADSYMEENADTIDADASAYAESFMTENEEAISNDAPGFVEATFGPEAAAQIAAGVDAFIKDAEENGVEVDPENAPGVKMTVEEITQQTMKNEKIVDLDGDGTPETTANEAIPIYAQAAAEGLTNGIIGAWEGNHVGILSDGKGVCAGYSKAFAYLLQYMSPEIYGKNGAGTDMSVSENWKTAEELYYNTDGNLDVNQDYLVDMVRITFDAQTSMFGEESMFGEVHFWNAVKVDGKWYYVDPCYTDIYVECMSRDRVEIDGTMNHMYFMFSHTTAAEMYDGNMKEIAGLYAGAATDKSYEDSWFARIATNTYFNDGKAYYMYDSTDQLAMMREFNEMQGSEDFDASDFEALIEGSDPTYSIVYHPLTDTDVKDGGADSDFTALIEFNYKENEDDDTSVARVRNASGEMEENELLTKLFAQYKEECEIYPSIKMTCALYGGKIYFNLSNCILSYDLNSCEIETVRVYNTVSAKRDNTNPFGGLAFEVCSESEADFTFTNRPIAAMTIKDDGQMYVSIATNLGFISGKDSVSDTTHYGYSFEESNYNPNYSTYMQGTDMDDSELEAMGFSKETNDNDEFMWSAVFVEKIGMSKFCGDNGHSYEEVTVEPFCGRDGYTEERCSKCGAVKADSRVVDEGSALTHHYVHFDETYYTKDSNGNWNKGDCYVCTVCGFAVSEPKEPTKNAQESEEDFKKRQEEYEKEKAIYDNAVETAGHTYAPTDAEWAEDLTSVTFSKLKCSSVCPERKSTLDCLLNEVIEVDLGEKVTCEEISLAAHEGECTTGVKAIYKASGTVEKDGKTYSYTATKEVQQEAGEHTYQGEFTWTKTEAGEWEASAEVACEICNYKPENVKVTVEKDEENSVAPTCTEEGKDVFVATAASVDEDENATVLVTDTKEEAVAATGHKYDESGMTDTWAEEKNEAGEVIGYTVTAEFTCVNCQEEKETVTATAAKDEENSVAPTCTEKGKDVLTATVQIPGEEEGKTATLTKEVELAATGHKYDESKVKFTWEEAKNEAGGIEYTATAAFECTVCQTIENVNAKVEKDKDQSFAPECEKNGQDVFVATATLGDFTATDTKTVELAATGHKYDESKYSFGWTEILDEEGKGTGEWSATVGFECIQCGNVKGDVEATVTKNTEASKAPTCTEDGQDVFEATATVDGLTVSDTKTVELAATGHKYDASSAEFTWTDADNGTCTATAEFPCAVCDHVEKVNDVTVVKITEESVEPGCTTKGKAVYSAAATAVDSVNGSVTASAKHEVEVPATGHTAVEDPVKEPTCTESGLEAGSHCSVCGETLEGRKEIPATGHVYEDGACINCGEKERTFEDVEDGRYYTEAVRWAVQKGITDGVDDTHFAPDVNCTRAQIVTFLYRAEGKPAVKNTSNPFVDVENDRFYTEAVLWAVENGITDGMDETHFAPDAECTRAQIVTFLHRAAGKPEVKNASNPFVDVEDNRFYTEAVLWAVENGITDGMDETHFAPDSTCTRGQAVTFLYRAYEK